MRLHHPHHMSHASRPRQLRSTGLVPKAAQRRRIISSTRTRARHLSGNPSFEDLENGFNDNGLEEAEREKR